MCRKWGLTSEIPGSIRDSFELKTKINFIGFQRRAFHFPRFLFSRGGHFIWSLLGWKGEMGKQQWNDGWTGKTRLVWPILSKQVTSVGGSTVFHSPMLWRLVHNFHFCLLHQIGLSPNSSFHGKFEFEVDLHHLTLETWAKSGLHHLTSPAACVRIRTSR